MTDRCPWCKFTEKGTCGLEQCDFEHLPMDEQEILKRAKQEARRMAQIRGKILRGTISTENELVKAMGELMDLAKAIDIMCMVLMTDFGMDRKYLRKQIKEHRMSILEKAKFAAMMADFKRKEGKK